VILKSYAKLNLYLAVLNKRKDNYHNIETLFERIDLHDTIILKKLPDNTIKIICSHPDVPADASNLCYKSAKLLQDNCAVNCGVEIKITKRIPVAAGLGGGSSNAASTLIGLNKLWRLGFSKDKLAQLGRLIGADVPFFIMNTPFAIATGRGDKIKPLARINKARLWHILAVPGIKVSTPLIYKEWDSRCLRNNRGKPWLTHSTSLRVNSEIKGKTIEELTKPLGDVKLLPSVIIGNKLFCRPDLLYNGLEEATVRLYPEVKRIKKRLTDLGVQAVRMSGSGPAVFGIVASKRDALCLAGSLKKQDRSLKVFVISTW